MGEPSIGAAPSEKLTSDRLDSWKEIAAYLNRDVTTVQRWEKREGMPVHRHQHDRIGSVYASREELDTWMRSRRAEAAVADPVPLQEAGILQPETSVTAQNGRRNLTYLTAAVGLVLALAAFLWLRHAELFWRNPLVNARFQTITDFGGVEQAAAVSRDGHFVAFLSDHEGQMDVWLTQVGSGQFHNVTHSSASELVNASIRTLGFLPDGSLVTFWNRKANEIGIWAAPILGGEPGPYLEGAAECDWSRDGSRIAYHTSGSGDPLFVTDANARTSAAPIFTAPAGLHSHFPLWSPDGRYLYFVQGSLPDKLDIWRIRPSGGTPERITMQNSRVSYPVLLDRRTLLYLATDADGGGPWLYGMDVDKRIPHQLSSGVDRYTSLAATADGRRLVVTAARLSTSLWSLPLAGSAANISVPVPISLPTGTGSRPRQGPGFLLYVSTTSSGESIWKLANGTSTRLWAGEEAQIIGAPAISPDGRRLAFSVSQHGQTLLYTMQNDGTNAHVLADSLVLQGSPAWAPDGQSIVSAVANHGMPRLYRIPIDGRPAVALVREYSIDPVWEPEGQFAIYSGPDIGTTFAVKAVSANSAPYPVRTVALTRGARHMVFLNGGHALVVLRGEIQHKDLWEIDLDSGAERQLTNLPRGFNVQDFDISPDGREIVLERVEDRSDVLLVDLKRP